MTGGGPEVHIKIFSALMEHAADAHIDDDHENADFQQALQGVDDAFQGKQPLEALQRINPVELGPHQLAADQQPGLGEGGHNGTARRHQRNGEHGADQQAQGLHYQLVEHIVDSQAAGQVHLGEAKAHIAGQLLSDVSGQQPKGAEGAQQRDHSHGVLAQKDITFLSFVSSLFGGCFFGLRTVRQR